MNDQVRCSTGLIRYENKAAALAALKGMSKPRRKQGRNPGGQLHEQRCWAGCGGWHHVRQVRRAAVRWAS